MDKKVNKKHPIGGTQSRQQNIRDLDVGSTSNHPETLAMTHNTLQFSTIKLASHLLQKAYKLSFFSRCSVADRSATPACPLRLLYKSPTLRKSIPKHYITLVKTSFASIQTSPPGFTSQCYQRLSQISLSGLSIFLQRLLPSVPLTDNTLPPLSFMLTLSYQHRAKELPQERLRVSIAVTLII